MAYRRVNINREKLIVKLVRVLIEWKEEEFKGDYSI